MTTFEQGFAETEQSAAAAIKAAQALVRAARALEKAAKDGSIAKLRGAGERLAEVGAAASQEAANAANAWPFRAEDETDYLQNKYEHELIEAGQAAGLHIYRQDELLVAFPKIIRIQPTQRTVHADRKQLPTIRPSKLVTALKREQGRKSRFTSEQFLEALWQVYKLHVGKGLPGIGEGLSGALIKLDDVYKTFTSLPGTRRDYGRADFCRDLYLLNRSGLARTRSGAAFTFAGSTGTRQAQVLSFTGPDGATETYYAIVFTRGGGQ